MEHLKELLLLVKTIDIVTLPCPGRSGVFLFDIRHENPPVSILYDNKLKALKTLAVTDVLSVSSDNTPLLLKQLYHIHTAFQNFLSTYYSFPEPYSDEERRKLFLTLNLDEIFIIPDIFAKTGKYEVKQPFIDDLYDSILYREKLIHDVIEEIKDFALSPTVDQTRLHKTVNAWPSFCSDEILSEFALILGPYFSRDHQALLLELLKSGSLSTELLSFSGSGNKLADAFKQLYDGNLIVGCTKIELQTWIKSNFVFREKGEARMFSDKYLSDVVSSNSKQCQSPILDVVRKNGTVELIALGRLNKRVA